MPLDVELDRLSKDHTQYQIPQTPNSTHMSSTIFIPSMYGGLFSLPLINATDSACSKLYCIQGDIIREVFNHNLLSSQTLNDDWLFGKIIQLDHKLMQWKQELHPALALLEAQTIESMDHESCAISQVQTVLTLRFLNIRALLLRKVVERSLDQIGKPSILDGDMGYSLPIEKIFLQGCTDSCVQTITIIHRIAAKWRLLPAWWYTAYYGKSCSKGNNEYY
jgi:hypothetical protein